MHMCYSFVMPTSAKPAPTRAVVLLQPNERKRLERLAARERVSSGEILRRGLHVYEEHASESERESLATLLVDMNAALDGALISIRSARADIRDNLKKIRQMREARA